MAFTVSSGVITQTGRDTNLSGLNGLAGVTVTTEARNGTNVTYYDLGTNRLVITGTVFHDPEVEIMLFHNTAASIQLNVNQGSNNWQTIASPWTKDSDGYLVITHTSHGLLEGDAIEVRLTYVDNVDGVLKRKHRIRSVTTDTITLDNSTEWDIPPQNGQFTKRACYNYGREITNNGKTRTSRATGLYFTGWSSSVSFWNPGHCGLSLGSGSYFYARGGTIHTARPMSAGSGTVDIKDTVIIGLTPDNSTLEWREFSGKGFLRNFTVAGMDLGNYTSLDVVEFTLLDATLIETLGSYYEVNLSNLDTTTNVSNSDIGNDAYTSFSHRYYKLYNSVLGSSVQAMWRNTRGSAGQLGAVEMYKTVKPTVLDTTGTGVADTKIYVQDTPSAYAKKASVPNQNMDYVNGIVKATNTTPPVVTILDHGFSNDDVISIFGFTSTGGVANGDPICGRKKVTVIDSDTVTLQNLDGTDVVGAQTFDLSSISDSITNVSNSGGLVQLTVSTDFTGSITTGTGNDRVYVRGIVGGSNLEALNGRLYSVNSVTSTTIVLNATWPTTNNTYTSGGTFNKIFKGSFNTTTTYDHLSANVYQHTTDSNGEVAAYNILIGAQIHEYTAQEPAATQAYGGPYAMDFSGGYWRHTGTNTAPAYSDWDTTRFGGFYKVDRRGVGATTADIFQFKFCNYNKALSDYSPSLLGANTLTFNWVMFNDASITETNKATVDAYTTIDSPEQFYDRAKSYLYDNYAGETATIVTRNGTTINAGSYNIVVDASAASVFAFDGSTITIKSTQFVGNITSSGTFTLLNGAEILGTYGSTTVLPWTVTNVEAGSTIQIYNVTQAIEIENYITSGTAGTKITATGSYSSSEATAGDTIRLRITCQAGVNALLPFESFGVATAAGITFRADQSADTVYNANNIDGSAITGITVTPDYTNIQIDVDDNVAPYEITAQQIYNFYSYIITTAQGIANFYGAITPIDRLNYRINSSVVPLKIQNTGTTDVVINGGRLYRDDNVSIIDTNPATGAGTGSLVHDTGFLLQYIQPQVEAAVSTIETDVASIKKKTNLISALV